MIKSAIIALIKQRLGNRTDVDIDSRITAELDVAQEELERHGDFIPWFLLDETQTLTFDSVTNGVAVPTGFLEEHEDGGLMYNNLPLTKYEYKGLVAKFKDYSAGPPQAYALVNSKVYVFPTPDATYVLPFICYIADTLPSVVATGAANLWMTNASKWLLSRAGRQVARFISDANAAQLFGEDEASAASDVYKKHIDRAERGIDRQMGDE